MTTTKTERERERERGGRGGGERVRESKLENLEILKVENFAKNSLASKNRFLLLLFVFLVMNSLPAETITINKIIFSVAASKQKSVCSVN